MDLIENGEGLVQICLAIYLRPLSELADPVWRSRLRVRADHVRLRV